MALAPYSGPPPPDVLDLAAGVAAIGARTGVAAARTALSAVRPVARLPVIGPPVRRAAAAVADEGRRTRLRERARLEAAIAALLATPEIARAIDRVLAGPLTEALGRSLAEHRVAERLAGELVVRGAVDDALAAALDHEATQRLVERTLASPGLERMLAAVLDSRLVPALTDRLLRSPEMQAVLEYVATSPQLRRALTEQSSSLAEEMVGGIRTRAEALDDAAERRIRGWLRRPRPSAG